MDRIRDLWNNHRLVTLLATLGVLAVVVGIVGYLILKRPADKSCPAPCTIETTPPDAPVKQETNWPLYGFNRERTRYLDAPQVKPPFAIRWNVASSPVSGPT